MTFFGKILAVIGHLFTNLLKEAEQVYDKLPENIKAAIFNGSGIIAVINRLLDEAPTMVVEAIRSQFPGISEQQITVALQTILRQINIEGATSLEDSIKLIQAHLLKAKTNGIWEGVSFGLSGLLAVLFTDKEAKFAVVSQVLEAVYHKLVKPKIEKEVNPA